MRYWLPSPTSRFARQRHTWAKVRKDYWEQLVILGQATMIRITRPESSKDDPGRSSPGLHSGQRVDMARKGRSPSVRSIERFVARRPGFCLGAALSAGIALGWWVKRS